MLTVQSLVEELGLRLAAGEGAHEVPVRWVHSTELLDPTPWLAGGELLLTTGMHLRTPEAQRAYVSGLAGHGLAGLGFGTGFDHRQVPAALLDEADAVGFPVFEVPFELPFIAITEKVAGRLVNEHYEVLQRGIAIHERLERIVLEERGLQEVVRELAGAIAGAAVVLDSRGRTLASAATGPAFPPEALELVAAQVSARRGAQAHDGSAPGSAAAFWPEHPALVGPALALPVAARGRGGPEAWLVATRHGAGLRDFERLVLQHGVTVVALELMRERVMRDTERRLAGDVLAEALSGALDARELETRLRPFGVGQSAAVVVFDVEDPAGAEQELRGAMLESGVGALVATRGGRLCAVVDARGADPVELAVRARRVLAERHGAVRGAASRPAPLSALRRSFQEARCALAASALAAGSIAEAPPVASYRDLGAFQLLLALQDDEALRLYCDSVLGPLDNAQAEEGARSGGLAGDELVRSLEAFIEHNGQWEGAARALFCHRHTLRYRIRRIEELTGRDLGRARDRIEFWLALRGRELLA